MLQGKTIKDYPFVIFVGEGEPHTDYMHHIEDFLFIGVEDFELIKDDKSVWRYNDPVNGDYAIFALNPFGNTDD